MLFNSEVPQCSPTRLSGVSFRPKSCHRFTQLHLQSLGFDLALAFPRTNTVTSRFQSEIELEVWVILKQCGRRVDKGRGEYSQQSWLHDNAGERRVSTTQKSLLIDSPALAEWIRILRRTDYSTFGEILFTWRFMLVHDYKHTRCLHGQWEAAKNMSRGWDCCTAYWEKYVYLVLVRETCNAITNSFKNASNSACFWAKRDRRGAGMMGKKQWGKNVCRDTDDKRTW